MSCVNTINGIKLKRQEFPVVWYLEYSTNKRSKFMNMIPAEDSFFLIEGQRV